MGGDRAPHARERHLRDRRTLVGYIDSPGLELDIQPREHGREVDRQSALGSITTCEVEPDRLSLLILKPDRPGVARAADLAAPEGIDRDHLPNQPLDSRVRDLRHARQTRDASIRET